MVIVLEGQKDTGNNWQIALQKTALVQQLPSRLLLGAGHSASMMRKEPSLSF